MASSEPTTELTKSLIASKNDESNNTYHEEYQPRFVAALILFPPVMPFFWKYHVDVNDKELSFGYTNYLSRRVVSRTDIISAEPFEIKPMQNWGGWGIRMRLGKCQTGYIAQGGPGVLLKIQNGNNKESVYVFSCKEPKTVCDILNNRKIPAQGHVVG